MTRNRPYCLFMAFAAAGVLLLNLLDAPTLSDDMVFRFKWTGNEGAEVEPISSFSDLLDSAIGSYFYVNGRFTVNFLAQLFMTFVPPVVVQTINSLLFVLLLHLVNCLVCPRKQQLFVAVMAAVLLFVVFQGLRSAMLWQLGAYNYLWVLVATAAFLLYLRRISSQPFRKVHLLLSPVVVFLGWTHEGLSLPVSLAFTAFLLLGGHQARRSAVVPYMLFYLLGSLLCLLSPGILARSADAASFQSRMISGAVNYVFNVRITWLLMLVLLWTWFRKRDVFRQHVSSCRYAYVALASSMGIVLLCGTNLERVAFFNDFIAMVLLLSLLRCVLAEVWQTRLVYAGYALLLLCFVPVYAVRKENHDIWVAAEQQMKQPGRELISVGLPERGKHALADYLRDHYAFPSFEFGYYCCYMGFDANDHNMRCAARLYGKERMAFLPEQVVDRMESDSAAYENWELDSLSSLYIWQMPLNAAVDSVVFELNDEDVDRLNAVQRLLAFPDSLYVLDDFRYETIKVVGRNYLVFTRPTTNIFRRIKSVRVSP